MTSKRASQMRRQKITSVLHPHTLSKRSLLIARGSLAALILAGLGVAATTFLSAATFTSNSEAEDGIVSGNAAAIDSTGASNSKSIAFGITAPSNVKALTGGNSIGLMWDMPTVGISKVEVYRNNTRVTTLTPGTGVLYADQLATRYIDKAVTPGTTYQYKVRTISNNGSTSPFSATVSATHPTNTTPVPTVTIDASQAPDLANYLTTNIIPEIQTWYPKISDAIAFPDYTPRPVVKVVASTTYTGVAVATGWVSDGTLTVNATWIREHPEGGGLYAHEITHLIQAYPGNPPGWLTEGLADWTREWLTHERYKVWWPHPAETLGTYSPGSYMMQWTETQYSPGIIRKLNVAAHNGQYNANILTAATGKTAEQLYADMSQQYFGTRGAIAGIGNQCIDVESGNTAAGVKLQVAPCYGTAQQTWMAVYRDGGNNGTSKLRFDIDNPVVAAGADRCMDVTNGGTADGTVVLSQACTKTAAQEWTRGANNSLVNPRSGKCLATAGGSSASGSQLVISTCNGSASQKWNLPQ